MHQTRKNINSTNKQEPMKMQEPQMKTLSQFTNKVFNKIVDHKRKIPTNLTGKFTVTSNRGNNCLFVLYL